MRGKTCEVKAATPKGEGCLGGKKFHSQRRGNGNGHHHYRQNQEQYGHTENQQLNNHMHPSYAYVGYPMMSHVHSGPTADIHSSHFHQGYHPSAFDGYGATMYYHGSPVFPEMHPSLPSPPATSRFKMSRHDLTKSGASSHIQSNIVLDPYSHLSSMYAYDGSVAFAPMVAMPSAAESLSGAAATHVSVSNMRASVVQPFAPGIPIKGRDSPAIHD
jgi:hypothetical protein